jgi:hypothetical protein
VVPLVFEVRIRLAPRANGRKTNPVGLVAKDRPASNPAHPGHLRAAARQAASPNPSIGVSVKAVAEKRIIKGEKAVPAAAASATHRSQ